MANHCQLVSSSKEPHTLGQELDGVGPPVATPDGASKPIARYNSPAKDPITLLMLNDMNIAFVESSQMMNANLKHSLESLERRATMHNIKTTVQVASPSYDTRRNTDLPTREESRTPSDGNNCCSPMQPTPSMREVPSGSPPMPSGKWGSGRVGRCSRYRQVRVRVHFLWEVPLCLTANGEAERKEVEGKMEKKSIHPLVQIATTQMTKTLELTTPKLVGGTCCLLTMVVRGPRQQNTQPTIGDTTTPIEEVQ
jgi:hypothetical protein